MTSNNNNVCLLNDVDHRHVTVSEKMLYKPGDGLGSVMVQVSELQALHHEYPLFIKKDPVDGHFFLSALVGLMADENLLSEHCDTQPLMLRRGPFLIGFHASNSADDAEPVAYIDMADSRVNASNGQRLFDDAGAATPFMGAIVERLNSIHQGQSQTQAFVGVLADMELIEPVSLDICLDSGQRIVLKDLYTVGTQTLSELSEQKLCQLHSAGWLPALYALAFSLANVRRLITLKNAAFVGAAHNAPVTAAAG